LIPFKIGVMPNKKKNQTLKIAQSEAQPIRQKSTLEVAGLQDIIFKT